MEVTLVRKPESKSARKSKISHSSPIKQPEQSSAASSAESSSISSSSLGVLSHDIHEQLADDLFVSSHAAEDDDIGPGSSHAEFSSQSMSSPSFGKQAAVSDIDASLHHHDDFDGIEAGAVSHSVVSSSSSSASSSSATTMSSSSVPLDQSALSLDYLTRLVGNHRDSISTSYAADLSSSSSSSSASDVDFQSSMTT
jgi:hypothetical protein